MKFAEKFKLPIITLLDTPGAYPGLGAEERGQGIGNCSKNLFRNVKFKSSNNINSSGEGASGGAL